MIKPTLKQAIDPANIPSIIWLKFALRCREELEDARALDANEARVRELHAEEWALLVTTGQPHAISRDADAVCVTCRHYRVWCECDFGANF